MLKLQGEMWLEFVDLTDIGIEDNTIRHGILRNSPRWYSIKDPNDRRKSLIRYSSLAERYKGLVRDEMCGGLEPDEWLVMQAEAKKQAEQWDERDGLLDKVEAVCEEGYRRYLHYYRGADTRQQRNLGRAAGTVEVLAAWYKSNGIAWKSYEPINEVAHWVQQHPEYFQKKYLPTNPIRLKEKVIAFAEGSAIEKVICLPRSGNDNRATKKKEMWWQGAAIELRTSGKNWTQAQIFRKLRDVAVQIGKDAPSESTVRAFLGATEHLTVAAHTDLNNKLRQRHRTVVPLKLAMHSHACWEVDGTKVQSIGHLTGKRTVDGRKETKSLSIVAVRDVYSGSYIGYWYGYGEDANAYHSALKMAVDITGHLPYELKYDQFPGHNTPESLALFTGLENAGVKLTKTSRSEGKASAERAFYTLQQVFEADKKEFIGLGIKAGIAHARPTELYISRIQREYLRNGWDFNQAWMSHAETVGQYNHTVLSTYSRKHATIDQSPWTLLENGVEGTPGRAVEAIDIAELFWRSRNEGIRNGRIEFAFKKQKHQYYIAPNDYDLLEYQRANVQVVVRFDPADFSTVMVFSESGEFLAELKEQEGINLYGPDAEYDKLAKFKQEQNEIKKISKAKLDEYVLTDEVAALLPTLTPKRVHGEALEAYAMNNADSWTISQKPKKQPKVEELGEFDAVAFARSKY